MMQNSHSSKRGYVLAACAGAVCGGIAVTVVTKAIPRIMSQIMGEMMSKMMSKMPPLMMEHMKSEGFDPAEMCACMKKMFSEVAEQQAAEGTPSA
jgi:hypothetical protein